MKAKVNPQNSEAEVLSIRRTRKEEILLVLKKGGDVSAFEKALDQVVGKRVEVKSLVSETSVDIRDLDETITREEQEVVAALCITLSKPKGCKVQAVEALRRCTDCGGLFSRGGCSKLARAW